MLCYGGVCACGCTCACASVAWGGTQSADIAYVVARSWLVATTPADSAKPLAFAWRVQKEVFDNPLVQMGLHLLVPRRFAFYGAAAAGSYPLDMSQCVGAAVVCHSDQRGLAKPLRLTGF